MTIEQLAKEIKALKAKVSKLESDRSALKKEYITPMQATRMFGVSDTTLRRWRNAGMITDFTMSRTGRGIKYSVAQLEKLCNAKITVQ